MPNGMDAPLPTALDEHVHEKTGEVAMTTPGHCYDCNDHVGGDPDYIFHFDDTDISISVWVCVDCLEWQLHTTDADWNDAAENV